MRFYSNGLFSVYINCLFGNHLVLLNSIQILSARFGVIYPIVIHQNILFINRINGLWRRSTLVHNPHHSSTGLLQLSWFSHIQLLINCAPCVVRCIDMHSRLIIWRLLQLLRHYRSLIGLIVRIGNERRHFVSTKMARNGISEV